MDLDELEPRKSVDYEIGGDLTKLSVEELKVLIDELRDEISRIEQALGETFEDASPHECCEVVWHVVGNDVTPVVLAALSPANFPPCRKAWRMTNLPRSIPQRTANA